MEANEIEDGKVLMIGDFVIGCIETDIVGEATYKIPCKVTDIHHYGDVICEPLKSFPDELDWQDGDDFGWIEAIPLTAEVLEKNGFHHHLIAEKGFKREEWTLSDDYYDIVVSEWSDSIWVFRYESTEMNTPHEQRTMSYLHQLQHAFKDCCVDKDIVL